jgi:hypothetical protein
MPFEASAKALHLTIPFGVAAFVYSIFFYLDQQASAQANRATSAWLQGDPYRRIDARLGVMAAFDLLYSFPLFSFRAFLRSALLSTSVSLIYEFYRIMIVGHGFIWKVTAIGSWLSFVGSIILSDYISLFVIRSSLSSIKYHPRVALLLAIVAGAFVIVTSLVIVNGLHVSSINIYVSGFSMSQFLNGFDSTYHLTVERPVFILYFTPAFLVHLWLPLYGLAFLCVRLLYPVFRAIQWFQWFLKEGDQHPLRAIGIVATVLAFVGTTVLVALLAIA